MGVRQPGNFNLLPPWGLGNRENPMKINGLQHFLGVVLGRCRLGRMVRCFDPARYPRIVALCGSLDTVTLIHRERRTAVSGYLQRQAGQGMTEYIVIVALVAIAAIAVYQHFGQVVRAQTAAMARELAGEDGSVQTRAAAAAVKKAAGQVSTRTLKSFAGNAVGDK